MKVEVNMPAIIKYSKTGTVQMKRYFILFCFVTTGLLGGAAVETLGLVTDAKTADAEDGRATRSASVMVSPGEQSGTVTRVRAGDQMSVIEKKGRWLKVRVNGRTGWITRSSVSSGQARTPVRKTRRRAFVEGRSKKRSSKGRSARSDRVGADAMSDDDDDGFEDDFDDDEDDDFDDDEDDDDDDDDEPEVDTVVVTANTKMRKKPSSKAKSVGKARSGDRLFVIERDGDWIKVENSDGDEGWVRAKHVAGGAYKYSEYNIRYFGSLGYSAVSQSFSTPDACPLCNYSLASGALTVGLGGDVIYDYSEEYLIAGDLNYRYTRANPGIRFVDPANMMPSDISFQEHRIDIGVRAGYKLGKETGMAGYGRIGYHYDRFGIDDVENFAVNIPKLPSEILAGVTVGVMLDVPQFNPKFAFRLSADMLISGDRVQTAGLEDGVVSTADAIWGVARLDYRWKPEMKITAQYHYSGLTTEWQGRAPNSMRDQQIAKDALDPAVDQLVAKRSDVVHALFVGVSKAL